MAFCNYRRMTLLYCRLRRAIRSCRHVRSRVGGTQQTDEGPNGNIRFGPSSAVGHTAFQALRLNYEKLLDRVVDARVDGLVPGVSLLD